jgi:hypothetical protein
MSDLLNLVIAKKLASKPDLKPGDYKVFGEATLEIDAVVTKCEDEECTPTNKLPIKQLLAVFVKRYNIKQAELEEVLTEAFKLAAEEETSIAEQLEFSQRSLNRVINAINKLPKTRKSGKTLVNGIVKFISLKEKIENLE